MVRALLIRVVSVATCSWACCGWVRQHRMPARWWPTASKAMGVDNLTSITYSGTARNGAVRPEQGHRRSHGAGERDADHQLHAHDHLRAGRPAPTALVSRATGPTQPPTVPGVPATDAGRVQPEHHRHAGQQQLEPGAEHLDDAVGLPEGRGRQQRHRAAAGRPAGGVVLAGQPQVAVRPALYGDRLHQQPEPGDQGRDAGRARDRRRPAGRVRVLELPEHERRAGARPASSRSRRG